MDRIWSVCGIRTKEIANGAAALALNVDDAMDVVVAKVTATVETRYCQWPFMQ